MRALTVCPPVAKWYVPVVAYITIDSFGTQHIEIVTEAPNGKKTSSKFSYIEGFHVSDEQIKEIWEYSEQ